MKETDYRGLNHFQQYCKGLEEMYVVVGGFATVMLLDEGLGDGHGKATHDIGCKPTNGFFVPCALKFA